MFQNIHESKLFQKIWNNFFSSAENNLKSLNLSETVAKKSEIYNNDSEIENNSNEDSVEPKTSQTRNKS